MRTGTKRKLSVAFGLIVSIVALWKVFHEINFSELYSVLTQVDYVWLLPNIALVVLSMYQRAWRWQYMIAPIKRVSFDKLLASTCIGFMA
ncbi:MAG: lysylphosphatidylglycerol synthase domain-containing protein, partial [candidate division Zixibacteria bacterium]